MASFTNVIQTLMKTNKDFPQKLKQHLVHQSSNVRNPFRFIVGLVNEGVLSDGSTDPALEGSENSELIFALRTWIKNDFCIEICGDLREPETYSTVKTKTSAVLPKKVKNTTKLSSSGTKLIDEIITNVETELIDELERQLVEDASKVVNIQELRSSLATMNVLNESEAELETGSEAQEGQWTKKTIEVACSKKAFGSLVIALDHSGNECILENKYRWLRSTQAIKKKHEDNLKYLADLRFQKESKFLRSAFFEQPAPLDGLQRIATFNYQTDSSRKGTLAVKFDKEKMVACFADGTLKLWNWMASEEKVTKLGAKVKDQIGCIQYDEVILVLGTQRGTIHLFDARTHEEKSSVRLDEGHTVWSLQFVVSTLVVHTLGVERDQFWWIDISRSEMQLRNKRSRANWTPAIRSGLFIDPNYSLLYTSNKVNVHGTKSERPIGDVFNSLLWTPVCIKVLTMIDLVSGGRVVVAGCTNGEIAIWNAGKFMETQTPMKVFRAHATEKEPIFSLCGFNGHLLSVDRSGKLLMWSGQDLESKDVHAPVPRILAEDFFNVSDLVAHERWFASTSAEDDIINIWTVPDLWLLTG